MENLSIGQLLFFGAIGLLLYLVLLRVFLATDAKLKRQDMIIDLLIKLCQKQGVTDQEIEAIKPKEKKDPRFNK